MFSLSNPLYNTVIVFVSIMGLLYIIKPDAIYDKRKAEFKQFGVDSDKTLLPIYVIGILLAIILYVLFNQLAKITTPDAPAPDSSYAYHTPYGTHTQHAQHGQHIRTEQFDTERDSELSSLKNQVMMMNHTINQMSQMNQLSQLSHMNHMNQLNQMQYGGQGGQGGQGVQSNLPRRHRGGRMLHASHASDRSGIYTQSEGSKSASAKSIDADGLVDSVLASVYDPSISYSQSAGTGSVTGSTASVGSSTYDPRSMNGASAGSGSASAILPNRYSI